MRQVPRCLLIGGGRVAKHFGYYFKNLHLNFTTWHRQLPLSLLTAEAKLATHIFLLIKDDAIENFIAAYLTDTEARLIHCSGSLLTPYAMGAHPLMTFAHHLYREEVYPEISFILDEDAPSDLLNFLPNRVAYLSKHLKAKYHALCVLSGNFSCLLWQKLFNTLDDEFLLDRKLAYPYLRQQMENILHHLDDALTGPLTRGDTKTLEKNLTALNHDPYQQIYQSFIKCYQELRGDKS